MAIELGEVDVAAGAGAPCDLRAEEHDELDVWRDGRKIGQAFGDGGRVDRFTVPLI